ncbi:ABC transporter ATP-binding protein [Limnohabitans sp. Rim8]|jgi:branched-chain amino acid transport system ATP-binding protein|uniref:ABC transporter ATP-binding protein n=1 Tax=Limnohabitans sp. Rim8 TaxID=1100718 RepID=UPI00260AF74C|nr:ABC transporter ATP-binding protein [Limnohabitans sp. Rim8]
MLHIKNLTAGYGKVNVLHGISLDVYERECVALIGANGAGKSTTLRCICGLNEVRSGSIEFIGERLDGLSGHAIVRKGITMCPEGRQVFAEMSVVENLEMGAHTRKDNEQKSDIEKMLDLFPVLRQRAKQRAGTLSGGEQEMLAIARALMARPKLCLFDEPSLGLAPKIVEEVEQILVRIKAMGTTIVLVEQNAAMALRLADRAYVLEAGEVVLHGTGQELKNDPQVSKAYLGY